MKVTALKCNNCGDTIYSRARHDFRWCSCKSCAIDGGQNDYIKTTGNPGTYELIDIEVKGITLQTMFQDWNKSIDKLGLIKGKI